MARLNSEYGSELHLLRMLGRHREYFDEKVRHATGAGRIEWCDFPSGLMRQDSEGHLLWDREWHHLNFLSDDDPARAAWDDAWPTHRPGPNWDAIGTLPYGSANEWLLVEAKANLEELFSSCAVKDADSVGLISRTLNRTKTTLGAPEVSDWMQPYYQYCNRLAALQVLNGAGSSARLLYIYFCGDHNKGRTCPASEAEWTDALAARAQHVGLPDEHCLSDRIHNLFINVQCRG
jgi:hypothetical protein